MTNLLLARHFKASRNKGTLRIYHKLGMHTVLATLSGEDADLAWCRFHAAADLDVRDDMMRKLANGYSADTL